MVKKIEDIEKRLKIIEDKLYIKEKPNLDGTSSIISNFFLVLLFGWIVIFVDITYLFCKCIRVMFMSRFEQSINKEFYLKEKFNVFKYILDKRM